MQYMFPDRDANAAAVGQTAALVYQDLLVYKSAEFSFTITVHDNAASPAAAAGT